MAARVFGDAIKLWGVRGFAKQFRADPRAIAAAIFAGTDSKGKPDQCVVDLFYSASKRKVVWTNKRVMPSATDPTPIKAYGSDTSIVTEFGSDPPLTFRANMERRRWEQTMIGKRFDERIVLFAVQLATWEVMYTKEPDIGGPIDYMVLSRAGIADHRKIRCQNNK
jgi:hypothetical protein